MYAFGTIKFTGGTNAGDLLGSFGGRHRVVLIPIDAAIWVSQQDFTGVDPTTLNGNQSGLLVVAGMQLELFVSDGSTLWVSAGDANPVHISYVVNPL